MRIVIQIILFAAICVVTYFVVESIQKPIRFEAETKKRSEATIQRLKEIRTAQVAYRSENKAYTGDFGELINFLKNGEFKVVRIIGDLDDSLTVATGKIIRDTIRIPVLDSLFKRGYSVDSIRYVPFTRGVEFEMDTAYLTAGNVKVNVFEAKIAFDILLEGLDPQLLVNYKADRVIRTGYAGLKVGSLKETTNNAGNWE